MLLAIHIGNRTVSIGGFEEKDLCFVARLSSHRGKTADEYAGAILQVLSLHHISRETVTAGIISSVVPPLNAVFRAAVRFLFDMEPLFVGPGIKTGIGIRCDDPSSVGADLIAACVAAHADHTYPAIVIDMSFATNMSVLDKKGNFIGVSIMPGVQMSLSALAEGTAQLPYVSLTAPRNAIGKNTADCMRSGVIFGCAAMIDGMIDRVRREMGEALPVIVTGDMASLILPHLQTEVRHDEHLILRGLSVLAEKNS